MQTFLPYDNLQKSIKCLDYKRLGKQRVEAMQIYNTLIYGSRWENHPAVLMWKGYEECLKLYHNFCINEWIKRGYKNNMKLFKVKWSYVQFPSWFGNVKLHSSHRSNLLRKDFKYYKKFNWDEKNDQGYFWPIRKNLTVKVK